MVKEAIDNETGIRFNRNNISNLRYADDAVLMADTMKQLQKLMDKLNETCKIYGKGIMLKRPK